MSTKHTPGPWGLQAMADGYRVHAMPGNGEGSPYIASILHRSGWSLQSDANAKVIQSAPELLAMVLRLIPLIDKREDAKGQAYCDACELVLKAEGNPE